MRVFLYPESYTKKGLADSSFRSEYEYFEDEGLHVQVFNTLELENVDFSFCKGKQVVYRGWHLKLPEYNELFEKVTSAGGLLVSSKEEYRAGRYMEEWLPLIERLTPKTHIFKNPSAAIEFVDHHDHQKFFVKDQVKSLKDLTPFNIISHKEELLEWIQEVEYFSGELEGGICLREKEDYQLDSEIRFFIFEGQIYSRDNSEIVPDIVSEVASKIHIPFFSVDIILNQENEWRVIEVSDGQVSKSDTWELENFIKIFN